MSQRNLYRKRPHRALTSRERSLQEHLNAAGFTIASGFVMGFSDRRIRDELRIKSLEYYQRTGKYLPVTLAL